MLDFTFHPRTKIIFGKESVEKLPEQIKELKSNGVLLHYGMGSAVKSGLVGKIKNLLDATGIKYMELSGVKPNPRLSLVREGIKMCRENNLDLVLAIGGGSVIDSSKAIGVGAVDSGDVWDFYTRERTPVDTLPVGVVLTLASAGSETSNTSVIRNEEENTKRSLVNDIVRANFAILNPELAFGVDKYSLACGITDTIMHTLDRYFTPETDTDLTDRISESIIKTAIKNGRVLIKDQNNYEAMANLFWCAALSHNELTGLGKSRDFSVHALERGISGSFDTAHPASLAMIWPIWARYTYKDYVSRFAQLAVNVFGIPMNFEDQEATALEGIERMEAFFKEIGMPANFKELGITPTDAHIDEILHYAYVAAPKIGTFFDIKLEDAQNILNACR